MARTVPPLPSPKAAAKEARPPPGLRARRGEASAGCSPRRGRRRLCVRPVVACARRPGTRRVPPRLAGSRRSHHRWVGLVARRARRADLHRRRTSGSRPHRRRRRPRSSTRSAPARPPSVSSSKLRGRPGAPRHQARSTSRARRQEGPYLPRAHGAPQPQRRGARRRAPQQRRDGAARRRLLARRGCRPGRRRRRHARHQHREGPGHRPGVGPISPPAPERVRPAGKPADLISRRWDSPGPPVGVAPLSSAAVPAGGGGSVRA